MKFFGKFPPAQKFLTSNSASISAVALWGEHDSGSYNTSQSYVQIRKDNEGFPNGEVIGTSTAKTINQNAAPAEIIYTFDIAVQLQASSSYWLVTFDGPSETTNGTRYYGSISDTYADGYWSIRPAHDIYFRFVQ